MDVREFYGGDLQGVLDKMDYLQELGVEVIYFNPLFVSPSNHKYDIQDYDYIDPHLGKIVSDEGELLPDGQRENRFASRYIDRVTNKANLEASNEMFAQVVAEAHRRGMRVILDGVFNHCGSFNKWMDRERIYENAEGYDKGAYVSADSPYRNYFDFHNQAAWPYNNSYDGWWGHDTLPKLNYEGSQELMDYVLHVAKKWVSPPYNVDGWRLDVAADLGHSQEFNHHFWQEFRKAVKEANPEAIILAEHYGNTRDWLQGNEWDTVMNYDAFMEPVTWFLTGMEKHSDDYREDLLGNAESFWGAMRHHTSSFSMPSWQVAMNELSNHDHSRFLTRTNHKVGRTNTLGPQAAEQGINKAVFREGVVIQMTWTGAPTIYYGDEAGKLRQFAPPLEIYKRPDNIFVADFMGNPTMNFLDATMKKTGEKTAELTFGGIRTRYTAEAALPEKLENVVLGIRPEHIGILEDGSMKASIYTTLPTGMETTVKIRLGEQILSAVVFGSVDYAVDQPIALRFLDSQILLFDKATGDRIAVGKLEEIAHE
jgi:alpha-glucosidase